VRFFSSLLLLSLFIVEIDYLTEVGQICGGFAGIQCRDDLVCVFQEPSPIDGSGICLEL